MVAAWTVTLLLAAIARAYHNVTVDAQDETSISFSGYNWADQNNYCTSTRYASSIGDTLTFRFFGTAVYVVGTIDCDWSGLIKIILNGNGTTFNRRGCSLLPSGVSSLCEYPWFTASNLDPAVNNNLTVTLIGPPTGQAPSGHIIADLRYITYTAVDPSDTVSSALPSSTGASASTTSTAAVTSVKSHSNTGAIAGGVVAGIIGLLLLILGFLLCRRRRARQAQQKAYRDPDLDANPYPPMEAIATPYTPTAATTTTMETTPWHPGMLLAGSASQSQPTSSARSISSKDGRYTAVSTASPPPASQPVLVTTNPNVQEADIVHRIASTVAEMLRNPSGGASEPPPQYTQSAR